MRTARARSSGVRAPRAAQLDRSETEYSFRHALIRDVAYEQIPKARRTEKHLAAAGWAVAEQIEDTERAYAGHGYRFHALLEAGDAASTSRSCSG